MKTLVCLLLLCSSAFADNKGEFHTYDGPFDLRVTLVRGIAPETKVGFGKSLAVFAVEAENTHMAYKLYCTQIAPESGRTYRATEAFVSENFSFLHSWPVDRAAVPINLPKKGAKRLHRVVEIDNITTGPHPDLSCDIHTETPIK